MPKGSVQSDEAVVFLVWLCSIPKTLKDATCPMRMIEQILKLSLQGKSVREISRATGVSRPSVVTY